MKFSVVIATKDRAPLLDGALASLRAQEGAPEYELVVVDNGSSDATPAVARAHGAVYAFVAEPNRGKARNAGIARATGDAILFVDDDVVTPPHFLAAHAKAHRDEIFPLAVSGPILNVPDAAHRPEPTAANFSRAFFVTCNVSVRAASLRAVGGFDEDFDLYGWEDTELGARLRAHGVRRVFAKAAYLWHIKPPTPESLEDALDKAHRKSAHGGALRAQDADGAHQARHGCVRLQPGARARARAAARAAVLRRPGVVDAHPVRARAARAHSVAGQRLHRRARTAAPRPLTCAFC